jgi:hypothetical protein
MAGEPGSAGEGPVPEGGANTSGGANASGGADTANGGTNAATGGETSTSGGASSGGSGGSDVNGGSAGNPGGKGGAGGKASSADCLELREQLAKAIANAQECEPDADDQCLGFVQGECCPVAVNDPDSAAAKLVTATADKVNKACGAIICAAVLCAEPAGASCDSQGSGSGRCVSGFGFAL